MSYLLAKLSQCILNSTNGLVVNEVYVLQNGKCTIFANDSGKQAIRYFRIVPDDQELVCKLWEYCLNPLSCLCKRNECRFPVLLVEPIRTLQSYVCGFEQVKLYVSSNIPFVAIDATVVISMFHILHIMEISHTCLWEVIGMDNPTNPQRACNL